MFLKCHAAWYLTNQQRSALQAFPLWFLSLQKDPLQESLRKTTTPGQDLDSGCSVGNRLWDSDPRRNRSSCRSVGHSSMNHRVSRRVGDSCRSRQSVLGKTEHTSSSCPLISQRGSIKKNKNTFKVSWCSNKHKTWFDLHHWRCNQVPNKALSICC